MAHYAREAFKKMLADLRDGDKPLAPGDTVDALDGLRTVSRVYGWTDGHRLMERDGKNHFEPVRALRISFFVGDARRATVTHLLPPSNLDDREDR